MRWTIPIVSLNRPACPVLQYRPFTNKFRRIAFSKQRTNKTVWRKNHFFFMSDEQFRLNFHKVTWKQQISMLLVEMFLWFTISISLLLIVFRLIFITKVWSNGELAEIKLHGMKNLKAKINSNLMVDILLDYIACSVRIALLKKYWSHSLCFCFFSNLWTYTCRNQRDQYFPIWSD